MFLHIYVTRLKCLVRDRQMLFWTMAFPLILATLLGVTFTNLSTQEAFKRIPIAVVENDEYNNDNAFKSVMKTVSEPGTDKDGTALFEVTPATKEKAEELLKDNKIKGYIILDKGPKVVVRESGIHQSIIKSFLDDYTQRSSAVHDILAKNPGAAQKAISEASGNMTYTREAGSDKANPNTFLSFFYAVIAMTCLYGGFWGMNEVSAIQANLSSQAARVNLAPVHKLKIFGYSLCAALTIQLASVFILVLYMNLVLKVDFGKQLGFIMIACVAGSITGILMGALIYAINKFSEGYKTAILISVSMAMSFCSGLMSSDIKYMIIKKAPIMAYINPGNLIADSFYSLYYYTSYNRFFLNIGLLFAFSAIFFLVVYFILRRQRYASI